MDTKRYLYGLAAALLLTAGACSTADLTAPERPAPARPVATSGEVLVKFTPYVGEVLEEAGRVRSGAATRSGVRSVDEVLDSVDGCDIERIFPVDESKEDRCLL